jgi:hypothetical protein
MGFSLNLDDLAPPANEDVPDEPEINEEWNLHVPSVIELPDTPASFDAGSSDTE